MPTCTINGQKITVDRGTTVLQAAAEAGFDVPHFCYHPALSIPANCRMCLVDIERSRKLLPACYTDVTEGMVVHTENDKVKQARKAVLEFILVNHPVDCPICDQAGECKLQDYYLAYDAQSSRLRTTKVSKVKVYPLGPEVVYDGERCILCTRCVRFCDEITGTGELTVVERGDRSEIRTFPGHELENDYSMCTVDLCPVGALTSRDFRFKCRVWLLTSNDSICTGCSRGCSIHLEHHRGETQRYRPRFNPEINEYWMCDKGRLSYKELGEDRLGSLLINGATYTWSQGVDRAAELLSERIGAQGKGSVGVVLSPQASCEDLYVGRRFAEEVVGTDRLYIGGKAPGVGDDFLITPDKNPNRNGLLVMFPRGARPASFGALIEDMASGRVKTLYMMGSEIPVEGAERARFLELVGKLDLFILQAPRGGGLSEAARVVLPSCTHAEKEGTYINVDGVAQTAARAYAAQGQALPDWQIFMRMAGKLGRPLSFTLFKQLQQAMLEVMQANTDQPSVESAVGAEAGA